MPGWDCHGLPIELKVLQNMKQSDRQVDISHKDFGIDHNRCISAIVAFKSAMKLKGRILGIWRGEEQILM
nr:class I tRNA ligase family protein [Synechocystis sp. PCC 7509]